MEAQTYSVLEAAASREAVSLLLQLLDRPGGVEDLADRAGLSISTSSRRLKDLALAGVVSRPGGHDPYELTCGEPTRQFLEAASALSSSILEARASAEAKFNRRIRRTRLRTDEDEGGAELRR
jgi:DNA-binding IclR family transcriptional regulator